MYVFVCMHILYVSIYLYITLYVYLHLIFICICICICMHHSYFALFKTSMCAVFAMCFLTLGEAMWAPRVMDYTMSVAPEVSIPPCYILYCAKTRFLIFAFASIVLHCTILYYTILR